MVVSFLICVCSHRSPRHRSLSASGSALTKVPGVLIEPPHAGPALAIPLFRTEAKLLIRNIRRLAGNHRDGSEKLMVLNQRHSHEGSSSLASEDYRALEL